MARMLFHLPIALVALLSSYSLSAEFAERGTLRADGIFAVRGAAVDRAMVRVVPTGAAAYILPMGTERFVLDLPVDDTFLVSFERPGCPTKEVYFDTTVPIERRTEDFVFRFKVTLEHLEPELMFTYAGPVGFVRYMHELKDFGYETRYLIKVNEELKKRMEEYKVTGVDPKVLQVPTAAMVIDRTRDGRATATHLLNRNEDGEVAPTVREIPRMVHRLGVTDTEATTPRVERMLAERVKARPVTVAVPAEASLKTPLLAMLERSASELETADVVSAPEPHPPEATTTYREEELIVGPRMVRTVVRLTRADGREDELRKVVHDYGSTFFFLNDQSISEDRFNELRNGH